MFYDVHFCNLSVYYQTLLASYKLFNLLLILLWRKYHSPNTIITYIDICLEISYTLDFFSFLFIHVYKYTLCSLACFCSRKSDKLFFFLICLKSFQLRLATTLQLNSNLVGLVPRNVCFSPSDLDLSSISSRNLLPNYPFSLLWEMLCREYSCGTPVHLSKRAHSNTTFLN